MQLHETAASHGNWLFRWRSFLPLFLVAILIPGFLCFRYPDNSHFYDSCWEIVCVAIGFFGLWIRCITVGYVPRGTSGRNTTGQIADSLNTTGVYSLLRNPLYLGNYLMFLGVIMMIAVHSWWLPVIFSLAFWLYYERIVMAEEAFLSEKFGDAYKKYAAKVPAFIPNFRNWTKPELPFSFRSVLRREYSSLFALVSAMFTMEIVGDLIVKRQFVLDPPWFIFFVVAFGIYMTLRTIKKTTTWLDVDGR